MLTAIYTLVTRHKWVLHEIELVDTTGHSGILLECVKETNMYGILCECKMPYIGETGCFIFNNTIVSSVLNKSAVGEHGINMLLKYKGVLAR